MIKNVDVARHDSWKVCINQMDITFYVQLE